MKTPEPACWVQSHEPSSLTLWASPVPGHLPEPCVSIGKMGAGMPAWCPARTEGPVH